MKNVPGDKKKFLLFLFGHIAEKNIKHVRLLIVVLQASLNDVTDLWPA